MKLIAVLFTLAAVLSSCKPQEVSVSPTYSADLPECRGYVLKHTSAGEALTVTIIAPDYHASLMTFQRIGAAREKWNLTRASKGWLVDLPPSMDTSITASQGTFCLQAGPGDYATDPCLKAWLSQGCVALK